MLISEERKDDWYKRISLICFRIRYGIKRFLLVLAFVLIFGWRFF